MAFVTRIDRSTTRIVVSLGILAGILCWTTGGQGAVVAAEDGALANRASERFPPLAALPPVPVPADNPITPAKVKLGRMLYFDKRTSGNT